MAEVKTDQEPSIEEILESIRQIISEDGEGAPQAAPEDKAVPLSLAPEAAAAQSKDKAVPLSLKPEAEAAARFKDKDMALSLAPETQDRDKDVALSLAPEAQARDKDVALSLAPETQARDKDVALSLSPAAEAETDDNILDLTRKVEPEPVVQAAPQPDVEIEMMDKPLTMDNPMTDDASSLISAQTAAVATDELSKLLAGNFAVEKEDVAGRVGKVTLEDITRELMKPLVKTWINQNLPAIVEKAVQKEVEKLARRVMDR